MAPRKNAAQRAAEAAEAGSDPVVEPDTDDAEPTAEVADGSDDDDWRDPKPDPDLIVEPETGDADALRYQGADRLGAPEPYVHKKWPHAARGDLASQLLAAATVLGYPLDVVRSTSDGFRYPESIDRYLFPSEYAE